MKDDKYSHAIESGKWYDHLKEEHDYAAFFAAFEGEMATKDSLEGKLATMRRYGIWFGPQR